MKNDSSKIEDIVQLMIRKKFMMLLMNGTE